MQLDLPLDGGPQLRNVERENPLLAGFGLVVLEIQDGGKQVELVESEAKHFLFAHPIYTKRPSRPAPATKDVP